MHVTDDALALTPNINTKVLIEDDGSAYLEIGGGTTDQVGVIFSDTTSAHAGIFYNHNADYLWFKVNGNEAMVIDSSQNVGIGVSDPAQKLEVYGKVAISGQASPHYGEPYESGPPTRTLEIEGTARITGANPTLTLASNRNYDNPGTAALYCQYGDGSEGAGGAGASLLKGGKENATLSDYRSYTAIYSRPQGSGSQNRLNVASDGTLTASASNDISDERLKENISTITTPLAKINAITGRTFTWKSEANMSAGTKYGIIAQELEPIIPDLVFNGSGIRTFDENGNLKEENEKRLETDEYAKSVTMSGLIPVLIEAVKELSAKVEALENA
jgi:hypothetical protein